MTTPKRYSNLVGFDDAPFVPDYIGRVKVAGAVFTGLKLTGVMMGDVEKDGADSAERLAALVTGSRFAEHIQLVMLQGIALAGFNVVDIHELHRRLAMPVLVVSRKYPDLAAIRRALLTQVRNGDQKWGLIDKLDPPEPVRDIFMQRVGLTTAEATAVIDRFAVHSYIPEPLRVAHLIAGAVGRGESRGGA